MSNQPRTAWIYMGSYTHTMPFVKGRSAGIAVYQLDYATGALTHAHTVTGVVNPSYLAVDVERRALYSVEEYAVDVREVGGVAAFRVDPATGALTLLNRRLSVGTEPAHISVTARAAGSW